METVREAMAKRRLNVSSDTHKVSPFDDGTLIRLYDYGHDMGGKFSHINVSYGMVDVRKTRSKFYHKNENGIWEGYQRVPTQERIENITKDFTKTRLNPITVAVMPDGIDVIDGQGRDTSVKSLYRQNKIKDYYIPCVILENASESDCGILFAEQYKNTVYVDRKCRVKVEAVSNNEETVTFLKRLVKNGLPVYNDETKEIYHGFNAIDTYQSIYNSFKSDTKTFDRIIGVIANVWVSDEATGSLIAPRALQADIIRGVSEMYVRYKDEINDTAFIKRLSKFTPADILDTIVRNTPKKTEAISDKKYKYIRTFVDIYNSARQPKKLVY